MSPVELLPGTLDLLVLKAVSLGPEHGYGILLRIEQISAGHLPVQQGTLYPALYRLEDRGFLATEWGTSSNNRRAKFYRITAVGKKRLAAAQDEWKRFSAALSAVLSSRPRIA